MNDKAIPSPELDLRLYILMRTDLVSMNPGKAVAQGAHAANQFVEEHQTNDFYKRWAASTPGGFGTTITLGVDAKQMYTAVHVARALNLLSGVVHDPTYPLIDGDVLHLLPLDTCAYIFGEKDAVQPVVGNFNLMP